MRINPVKRRQGTVLCLLLSPFIEETKGTVLCLLLSPFAEETRETGDGSLSPPESFRRGDGRNVASTVSQLFPESLRRGDERNVASITSQLIA